MAFAMVKTRTVAVTRALAKVELAVPLVHAQIAGEIAQAFGGSARTVEISQKGALNGWLKQIEIAALDADGRCRASVTLELTPDGLDTVRVAEDGARSMADRLCGGFATAIAHEAARVRRLGLTPAFYYVLQHHIEADAKLREAAIAALGLGQITTMPAWAAGYEGREILSVAPAGSGLLARFQRAFRR